MPDGKYISISGGKKVEEQAIEESTGSSDSSKMIRTDSNGLIDPSLLPSNTGFVKVTEVSGHYITYTRLVGDGLEILYKGTP